MNARGRRWTVAAIGLIAATAGFGLVLDEWRLAHWAQPEAQPDLLQVGLWVQAFHVAGLSLLGFGLIAWLLALAHWLWQGTPREADPAASRIHLSNPSSNFVDLG